MRKTLSHRSRADASGDAGLYASLLQPELAASVGRLAKVHAGGLSTLMSPDNASFTHKLHLLQLPRSTSTSTSSSAPAPPFHPADLASSYKLELLTQISRNVYTDCIAQPCDYPMLTDIAGNALVKDIVQGTLLSLSHQRPPSLPWHSILLYGPPGVGKTMLVRSICNELGKKAAFTCFCPAISDLTSKYIGESERLVKALFALARNRAPAIIVVDEMDSLTRKRSSSENEAERRIKTEFMRQMDDLRGVMLVGTTNTPWELDLASLKRFQRRILVAMPSYEERRLIFSMRLGDTLNLSDSELATVLENTEGYSGSDLDIVCNEAMLRAMKAADAAKFVRRVGSEENMCWVPCKAEDLGAVDKDKADFLASGARVGQVTMAELIASVNNCRPTVLEDKLPLYSAFLQKYGLQEQASHAPQRVLDYFC